MSAKLGSHEKFVVDQLKHPEFAAEYLNEHWNYRGPKRMELLMQALHRVALARGITRVSRESGISRRALHKIFSEDGNPTAETLVAILDTFRVGIYFEPIPPRKRAKAKQDEAA